MSLGQRSIVAFLVVATGVGYASLASAQVDQVPLTWNAPPACPTAAAVLAEVERNLADAGEGRAPFVAVANVLGPEGGIWRASLRVEARGGYVERRFEAESCEAIASAAALIISLSAPIGGGTPVVLASPPQPRAMVATAPQPGPPTSEGYWQLSHVSVTVNGLVDGGTMPGTPAAGIEAAVGPSWTAPGWRLRVLAGAGFFPTQRVAISFTDGNFWLLVVSARGCLTAGTWFEIGLCAGAELAVMHASSAPFSSVNDNSVFASSTQFWPSPTGSAIASWNLSPTVAVFGRADVAVPGTQRNFHPADNLSDTYTVPEVAARGALGLEVRFY